MLLNSNVDVDMNNHEHEAVPKINAAGVNQNNPLISPKELVVLQERIKVVSAAADHHVHPFSIEALIGTKSKSSSPIQDRCICKQGAQNLGKTMV